MAAVRQHQDQLQPAAAAHPPHQLKRAALPCMTRPQHPHRRREAIEMGSVSCLPLTHLARPHPDHARHVPRQGDGSAAVVEGGRGSRTVRLYRTEEGTPRGGYEQLLITPPYEQRRVMRSVSLDRLWRVGLTVERCA